MRKWRHGLQGHQGSLVGALAAATLVAGCGGSGRGNASRTAAVIPLAGAETQDEAFPNGGGFNGSQMDRIDPLTGRLIGTYPADSGGLAVADGSLWVENAGTDSVWREPINPK